MKEFLDFAVEAYPVDPDRVYLVGYSCGGFAVWDYLATYGDEQLAAGLVLAGDGRPALADDDECRMAEVPVWAFHGEDDIAVSLAGDQDVIEALLQRCPRPRRAQARRAAPHRAPGHPGGRQLRAGAATGSSTTSRNKTDVPGRAPPSLP